MDQIETYPRKNPFTPFGRFRDDFDVFLDMQKNRIRNTLVQETESERLSEGRTRARGVNHNTPVERTYGNGCFTPLVSSF